MSVSFLQRSAGNSATTTLSSGVTDSSTSFPLTSDTAFLAGGGVVLIDEGLATEELAYYTGKVGGALTIPLANRGLEGGSAQAHAQGASVKGVFSADMWNNVIETLLNGFSATDGSVDATKLLPTSYLDTDTSLTANSDSKIATQKATKTYADTKAPTANPTFSGTVSIAGAITQTGTADHITLTPGTSKLVKLASLRHDNTTDTYKNNTVILTGWGFTVGDNSNPVTVSKTITLGVTFSEVPVVIVTAIGYKDSSDPTSIDNFTQTGGYIPSVGGLTTGAFNCQSYNMGGTAISSARRCGFSWVVIGTI